jgi:hypothetical protein
MTLIIPFIPEAELRPVILLLNYERRQFAKSFLEMPDCHAGVCIMEGKSDLAKRLRGCLNIKRKVELNTLLEYKAKAEAKVAISETKQALNEANVFSDGLVY